jgi:hypothetical protein
MKLVDRIGEILATSPTADVNEETSRYWSGEETGGCMETLTRQGIVLEELDDETARRERFKKLIGFSQANVPEPFEDGQS